MLGCEPQKVLLQLFAGFEQLASPVRLARLMLGPVLAELALE